MKKETVIKELEKRAATYSNDLAKIKATLRKENKK